MAVAPPGLDVRDSDAPVRGGQSPEVLGCVRVRVDRGLHVRSEFNPRGLVSSRIIHGLHGIKARAGKFPRRPEAAQPFSVHLGHPAGGLTRGEPLRLPGLVDPLDGAVDPAIAERLLDGVVVADAAAA